MASTGSSDVETEVEEDNAHQSLSPKKVGRAAEYPEFAIIWSYLENFCELLRFPELSLDGLEDAFNSHSSRNENYRQLEYLHKKLLVKLHKNFRPEKWEKALLKVAKEQNMLSSWDLENFGYDELKVCTKLELFKMLLESQFDCNNKLKTEVNKNYEADELRLRPFGRDMDGLLYWFHMDECGGVRLYSTEEDEVENESWKLLASDLDELEVVVEYLDLKSETNPKDIVMAKREEEKKKEAAASSKSQKGKKSKKAAAQEEEFDDDNPCARCYSNVHPDSILLCDKCDAAYHTACLRPPLLNVPQGDWFCPFCQQLILLERLKEKKTRLVARQKLRARQAKRLNKSGMNLSNILQGPNSDEEQVDTIRRSGRTRKIVDYTFRDFDEEIKDAVEVDINGPEMNGHPTGKPAFAVERFYSTSKPAPRVGKRRSRRLKDLDSASDTDSKTSDYEYDGSSDEDRPKRPRRHVYLRRHIIEDDDEEDENEEERRNEEEMDEEKSEKEDRTDEESSKVTEENGEKSVEEKECKDELTDATEKESETENSLKDSQVSGKESQENGEDTSSEKSGPTVKPVSGLTNANDDKTNSKTSTDNEKQVETKVLPEEKKSVEEEDSSKTKSHSDQNKKKFLDVPGSQSKPPPLERINSPKIDPLLDSLGFGALASCFSSSERMPTRPDPYGALRSPTSSLNPRSPLRPDSGFPTDRMGVPTSPSSYPRVSADSRYNFPSYGQASSYGSYFGYNQTDYASGSSVGGYPGSPPAGRAPSYGLSMPGTRQYPGYNQSGFSNRETSAFSQAPQSPSFNQASNPAVTPFGNRLSAGYPTPYPDAASRVGYYASSNPTYDLPSKSPYSHPSQGYYPDDPFSTGMYLNNPTANPLPPGGINSWSAPPSGSGSYFPQSG